MKLMQVKFPTLGEMVGFIRQCHPIINDYKMEVGTLKVEDTEEHRQAIKYHRGIIEEFPSLHSTRNIVYKQRVLEELKKMHSNHKKVHRPMPAIGIDTLMLLLGCSLQDIEVVLKELQDEKWIIINSNKGAQGARLRPGTVSFLNLGDN